MADRLLEWVAGLPSAAVYAVLMALSALENVFPPVPADVAVVLGAFLSRQGITSAGWLGLLCWLANTASSAWVYFFARRRGPQFFRAGFGSKLVGPEALRALEDAYARHGVFGVFVSRFLPGVRAAVTPLAGVVGMPPLKVLVPAATASGIWYAVLVGIGSVVARNWETAKALLADLNRGLGLLAALAVLAGAVWLWRRRPRPARSR